MNLESRISKVEGKTNPQDCYPYRVSVRFIDEDEATELARKRGLPKDTAVFVTYGEVQ